MDNHSWNYGTDWHTFGPVPPQAIPVSSLEQQQLQRNPQPTAQGRSETGSRPTDASTMDQPRNSTFLTWLGEKGFTPSTAEALVQAGFTSELLLKNMRQEDIPALRIEPLGQRRLLESCLRSLQTPPCSTPAKQSEIQASTSLPEEVWTAS